MNKAVTHSKPSSPQDDTFPTERQALLDMLLTAVAQIGPVIAANKELSERNRTLAPEVVQSMRDTGLLAMKARLR